MHSITAVNCRLRCRWMETGRHDVSTLITSGYGLVMEVEEKSVYTIGKGDCFKTPQQSLPVRSPVSETVGGAAAFDFYEISTANYNGDSSFSSSSMSSRIMPPRGSYVCVITASPKKERERWRGTIFSSELI